MLGNSMMIPIQTQQAKMGSLPWAPLWVSLVEASNEKQPTHPNENMKLQWGHMEGWQATIQTIQILFRAAV